eukprot:1159518-Pelagomonas_calceolata.AAC.4
MLSTDDVLNDRMLRAIVESGHSRVPIHRAGDKSDLFQPVSATIRAMPHLVPKRIPLGTFVSFAPACVPVYSRGVGTNQFGGVGLILVKELLQYKMSRDVPVCLLKMRSLPRSGAGIFTQPGCVCVRAR